MKVLEIDFEYYYYPEGISCIEDFIAYANAHYSSFIALTRFETHDCFYPYLVEEDTKEYYVNISFIGKIREADATILSRAEYDARLGQVVKNKCVNCTHYEENLEGDNLTGHRDKLSLDGECWMFEKRA